MSDGGRRCVFNPSSPCPWRPEGDNLELLRLIARGHTDAEIAQRLYISRHSVSHKISRLARLLGLFSYARTAPGLRAKLAAYAGANGLLADD